VVGIFITRLAYFTLRFLKVVFANQERSAMNPLLGEQPAKKLYSWGSEVLRDELEGWARLIPLRGGTVDHA
jgi:hypothetical protein